MVNLSELLRKRKMRIQFERKGLLPKKERLRGTRDLISGPIEGQVSLFGKKRSLRSLRRSTFGGIIEEILPIQKGKKRKGGRVFGRIKDKGLAEGGFF